MPEVRRSYCGLCHPRCDNLLHIENGKVVKITGGSDHRINRGALCSRGRLMLDHIYHPQRLNFPLKRTGERGHGKWQRLTWEHALES